MINKERISKLNLPKSWSDIKAYQLIELIELEEYKEEYEGYDFVIEQISILTGIFSDDDIFYELTDIEIMFILKEIQWLGTTLPNKNTVLNEFTLNGYNYKKINFNNMIAAEWLTLDYYCKNNYKLNVNNIIASCYRKYIIDDFGNEKMEEFTFDFDKRANEFKTLTLDHFPIQELLDFRESCFTNFQLTNKTNIEDDEEDIDEIIEELPEDHIPNYREKAAMKENERYEKMNEAFSWEKLSLTLANDNIVDSHKILTLPILYIFNIISMKNIMDDLKK